VKVRTVAGILVLAAVVPTFFGVVGTMYKGGFPEGFVVGLIFEGIVLGFIVIISLGLALLGVFD
jgi:hypothetical protein